MTSSVRARSPRKSSHPQQQLIRPSAFARVRDLTRIVGSYWHRRLTDSGRHASPGRTVALLGSSTSPFMFSWLGLVYQGYAVLLVA